MCEESLSFDVYVDHPGDVFWGVCIQSSCLGAAYIVNQHTNVKVFSLSLDFLLKLNHISIGDQRFKVIHNLDCFNKGALGFNLKLNLRHFGLVSSD